MKKNLIAWLAVIVCVCLLLTVFICALTLGERPEVTPPDPNEEKPLLTLNGPKIILAIPHLKELSESIPLLELGNVITQTTVTLLAVTAILCLLTVILTRSLTKRPGKLQVVTEKLVDMLYGLVRDTMGEHNLKFAPYIGTLFLSSITCTLIGMTQLFRSATADLSVTAAWALATTAMVWYNNIKNFGFGSWLKGFTEPVVVMTPMNVVSEIANPVSMAFRHFGNVAGGSVLTALIYGALAGLTSLVFGWLPEAIATVFPPLFQIGIPAVLSIYFDLFSGFVQAFVFSLLTMVYVGGACPPPAEIQAAKEAKLLKKQQRAEKRHKKTEKAAVTEVASSER